MTVHVVFAKREHKSVTFGVAPVDIGQIVCAFQIGVRAAEWCCDTNVRLLHVNLVAEWAHEVYLSCVDWAMGAHGEWCEV